MKKTVSEQLRNCAKAGCIRIIGASAAERKFGVPPAETIVLQRAEAVGLYALAALALKESGDRFVSEVTDEQSLEYIELLDRNPPETIPTS